MTQEENKHYAALFAHYQVRLKQILKELEALHAEMEPYMQDIPSTSQTSAELEALPSDDKTVTTCK